MWSSLIGATVASLLDLQLTSALQKPRHRQHFFAVELEVFDELDEGIVVAGRHARFQFDEFAMISFAYVHFGTVLGVQLLETRKPRVVFDVLVMVQAVVKLAERRHVHFSAHLPVLDQHLKASSKRHVDVFDQVSTHPTPASILPPFPKQ
ncbi:hypothetical protein H257_05543 [Aphanomyces astaci]|uniref:Secreted protein n=1 Tax=Aphanomyces astaci TaxID=112090 RepID=W4GQN9_APHAT|nr:hypothetical protein H257_05543 [Aphanomyces astaci]ETV82017.1 hypothetical protein H257_05543 [Aphanomyces astaci]|eukprot:XP_009828754.1 hypothetical protein H257_05543 [Aphanomyces astaci]